GVKAFGGVSDQLKGLTANGFAIDTLLKYYYFFNPYLFYPFLFFLVAGGTLLFVKKRGPILWCIIWLSCLCDVGFTSTQIINALHMPLSSFSSKTMLTLKTMIKPTERIWAIYPTAKDSVKQYPSVNLNASALYNMQEIDGYVSFTDRPILSLPNHNIRTLMMLSLSQNNGDYLEILQNHNDFLSMLGMKYLIVDKEYSVDIEKSYDKPTGDWKLLSEFNSHDINLDKNLLGNVVVTSNKVPIKPNTFYKITLDVNGGVNSFLYTKLSGNNY